MEENKTKKLRLHCPILLLCERKELAEFVGVYVRYLFKQGAKLPNLQILNLGKLSELPKFLRYVEENEDLTSLKKIRFLTDAGPSVPQKQQELETIKNASFLRSFTDYDYFLFPGKLGSKYWSKGYLEDVLVQTLKPETAELSDYANLTNIAKDFLLAAQACRGMKEQFTNYNKHVLHTYLAGTERYVGLSIGDATKAGAFDLGNEKFASLRGMLEKL